MVRFAHSPLQVQPSPKFRRVGFHITYFEACSAFTHVTACMLAKFLYRTLYTRGFSRFVTSTTAPIATGWSESCRAGFAPAERQRLTWRTKIRTLGRSSPHDANSPREGGLSMMPVKAGRYPLHPRCAWIGGHFTEPKEQKTQQSPGLGRRSVLQLRHS